MILRSPLSGHYVSFFKATGKPEPYCSHVVKYVSQGLLLTLFEAMAGRSEQESLQGQVDLIASI